MSAVASLLGTARVDVLDVLGGVGQHDHAIRADVHEPAEHGEHLLDAAFLHAELTRPEGGEERRVVRQDPEVSLAAGGDHHVDVVLVDAALGRDDFQM